MASNSGRRKRRKSGAELASNQLDFFGHLDDNGEKTGTSVLLPPTPPNHDGGVRSTMMSPESNTDPRPTYSQDWHAYNLAQQNEKDRFLMLLRDLCSTVDQEPVPRGRGRPSAPLSIKLFAAAYKVYSGFSARRFTSDMRAAHERGLVDHAPHFNSTLNYLASDELTEHLLALIELSAAPLASVETDFAADSTGFSTTTYHRWFDHKWGKERVKQSWIKTHLICGVKTNIVTTAIATTHESADAKQLPHLLERTAETFTINEVSADKAYSSKRNLREIEKVGGTPYIPFKSYAKARPRNPATYDSLWAKMFHYFSFNRDEFAAHYHKRSNVESTMAMIKMKFGTSVKSKDDTAQVNEVLAKVLCHNIVVLVHSFYELGIDPDFAASTERGFAASTERDPAIIDLAQYRARYS